MTPVHPKYPKVNNHELTKIWSEEHRKVPEQLKVKHSQNFEKDKKDFREKMALFREQQPDLTSDPKKSDVPKGSQNKVPKKFQENVQKVKSPSEDNLPMKWKFHGEPKKPPMNGYHKFHQDLWSSRELKVVPPRVHVVEISRRWLWVPQDQKELYKKQAEGLQTSTRWTLISGSRLSPEEYVAYREATCAKHKNVSMTGGLNLKIRRMGLQSPSSGNLKGRLREDQGLQAAELALSDMMENILLPQGDQKKMRKRRKAAAPHPPTVRMKIEILSRRTMAPAYHSQKTPLTWIPTEFSSKPEGTVLVCIPTNSVRGFPFLHTLSSIYCL